MRCSTDLSLSAHWNSRGANPARLVWSLALLKDCLERRVHYWVVGDDGCLADLKRLAAKLGLEDVTFWGRKTEDGSLYFLMSDLFVLPGLGGLALNHAMAHGVPVIAGPADGTVRDLVRDGQDGRLLDEVTPASLAVAITELEGRDPKAMGRAARDRVRTGFTLRHQVAAMADIVNRAVASSHGG